MHARGHKSDRVKAKLATPGRGSPQGTLSYLSARSPTNHTCDSGRTEGPCCSSIHHPNRRLALARMHTEAVRAVTELHSLDPGPDRHLTDPHASRPWPLLYLDPSEMCTVCPPRCQGETNRRGMPSHSAMWGVKGIGVEIWLSPLRFPVVLGCQRAHGPKGRCKHTHTWGLILIPAVGSGQKGAS